MGVFDGKCKEFAEWEWKYYQGGEKTGIDEFVERYPDAEFYIGTDSQKHSKKGTKYWTFTSCLIAYTRRKGGNAILCSENVKIDWETKGKPEKSVRLGLLRQRLLVEAYKSLEIGWYLNKKVGDSQIMTIHLDVNPSAKFDSGRYKDELVGFITSQGFNCEIKPNAPAASWAADARC
jgi:predicted RNase H-related nuclease YkuK (DUF458 family)